MRPIGDHEYLNLRTYVRHEGEPGIYFLSEWMNNRLGLHLGPLCYGVPYHFGALDYRHDIMSGVIRGSVNAAEGRLQYWALAPKVDPVPCPAQSLDEFLLEHYTAFTHRRGIRRRFGIRHQPWRRWPVQLEVQNEGLLETAGDWFNSATLHSANYSSGVRAVWIGPPHRI